MPVRKEDEIMAEYLLKGGKMLEKSCRTCGCPLFEVKGKTLCVVCAENAPTNDDQRARGGEKTAVTAEKPGAAASPVHHDGHPCTCGEDPDADSCNCNDGGTGEELAFTIHALCERIQNEKDPEHVLVLMNAVKAGCEALGILCRL